ncbi:MAG: hypothetical protein CME63_17005 [Halobacteriovoraceae bacterium]|nr:hypothetical protein [Halobacteriovoraceae bacterium]MBC99445.1 hypothetical protein [Halobacteriovoraceae bacterium]|tara:strand:+ start:30887 stop:31609 length:723 start_codon:yes stop_codon:yes gene_type:complete
MENHLSLIKTGYQDIEKRILPRFPFNYLIFKSSCNEPHVFAVKDISYSGMQLSLKDGGHSFKIGEAISGELHWKGAILSLDADVKWVHGQRLGVEFKVDPSFDDQIKNFLSISNIIKSMRPLHRSPMELDIPTDLKYWLQADGPVEIFVWCHAHSEISRFQLIMMDSFVEYQDGKGLKSGKVVTKRDLDTPLVTEDEFVFEMDERLDDDRLKFARDIVSHLPQEYLPESVFDFLKLKLGL